MIHLPWKDSPFVVVDLETTGKYPLEAEICEFAALQTKGRELTSSWQTLIRPLKGMNPVAESVHGLSMASLSDAPLLTDVIAKIHSMLKEHCLVAHHAPFDAGFLAIEFERAGLDLPVTPIFCTSLLARKLIPESHDHRLKTLVEKLGIGIDANHRAEADGRACLAVAIECFGRVGESESLARVIEAQGIRLEWSHFSIEALREREFAQTLLRAIGEQRFVELIYNSGSRPGHPRVLQPVGIVRNPEGDFLVAFEEGANKPKRYYLKQIGEVALL